MPVYQFGPYLLDPARRELLRANESIGLPPRAFDLIVYLLEHRQRAVGRDELIAAVWGRAEVTDNVLDQIILRARKALGDLGSERHYIATRPRFGFAWVAAVEVVEATPNPDPVRPVSETPASAASAAAKPFWLTARAWLTAALLALLAAFAWWLWPSTSSDTAASLSASSATGAAVVLPFSIDAEPQAAWARLGLMDLVAQRLRAAGIDILPSDNAMALLRGQDSDQLKDAEFAALAARIGMRQWLRGGARSEAGGWRVELRLFRADRPSLQIDAQAEQLLDAARIAADRLALAWGHSPAGVALPDDPALALRLQQIDAAVLADASDEAAGLLDALPVFQRDHPAVRLRAATLSFRRGRLAEATSQFETLLDEVSASDDPHLRGTVLSALGNLSLRLGNLPQAELRGDQAVALLAALPASPELGRALTGRGIARSSQGHFDSALEDLAQARMVLDGVGDRLGVARVDANLGILNARRDRFIEAEPLLAAGAERLAAFNDLTNELFARVALAQVRLGLLDPAAALSGESRLADLVALEPNAERRRYINLTRADVLAANGQLHAAEALLSSVREEASAEADIVLLGMAQSMAANWVLASDPARAGREAQAALNSPWEEEGPRHYAATWRVLIRARLATQDVAAAEAALLGFESWAASRTDSSVGLFLWLARAEIASEREHTEQATAAFEAAMAAAKSTRLPADHLQVAASYVPWLLARGHTSQAVAVTGHMAGFAEREFQSALLAARLHRALGHAQAWKGALGQARRLAGERRLPTEITGPSD